MPELVAEGVVVRRGGEQVLRGIDLRAKPGRLLAVLGPNGAGKSTLLRALAGLLPFEGVVTVGGRALSELSPPERARRLAFVPQRSMLHSALPVAEVVTHGRYAHNAGKAKDAAAVERALRDTRSTELAERSFIELSVGEQQRVLIARALATEARVLLLDEPTAALDVRQALSTFALLRRLADEGRTLVVVVHALADARRFADDAILLRDGQTVCAGAVGDVVASGPVREVYGVDMVEDADVRFEVQS